MFVEIEKLEIPSETASRIYVVGDIHGCIGELDALLFYLQAKEKLSSEDMVIFLGDYIDRGTDSSDVIELLFQFGEDNPNCVFLRGNHEDMMLSYFGLGGRMGDVFLKNGGAATIKSYGAYLSDAPMPEVYASIPERHRYFLQSLSSMVMIENYVFVHGGLNPFRDLEKQLEHEIFWIRDDFLLHPHSFDKLVVFGHTPFREVLIEFPYKIGLDTGLVFGNKLSCMELRSRRLLQVKRNTKKVHARKL